MESEAFLGYCHICQKVKKIKYCRVCKHWMCEVCRKDRKARARAAFGALFGSTEECCGPLTPFLQEEIHG